MSISTRLDRLERRTTPADDAGRVIVYRPGETTQETLSRLGLPADWNGPAVWLPEVDSEQAERQN